jgi:hypothetical protein
MIYHDLPYTPLAKNGITISSLQAILVICTTIICTSLIAVRILRLGGTRTLAQFWRTLEVMIESALFYVIVLVVEIIFTFIEDPVKGARMVMVASCLTPMTVRYFSCSQCSESPRHRANSRGS